MIERIKIFIESQGISIRSFEQMITASNGLIRKAIANNTDIQSKWVSIIVEKYPHLNPDWLLTGHGPMLKTQNEIPLATPAENTADGIPLIPFDAMAGIASGEISVLELECERYVVPIFRGADFLMPVKGSSMYPKYSSGDIVACKKIPLTDLFFQWNKVYVLDTVQGPLIKRIAKGSDADHITAVSENPKYEPFELHINQLRTVAIVMGVIRLE